MRGVFWLRVASVLVALFAASLFSFPSFPRAGVYSPPLVDRALKGDRLPSVSPAILPNELGLTLPAQPPHRAIPIGCDASFSVISSPLLARVFGRCTA